MLKTVSGFSSLKISGALAVNSVIANGSAGSSSQILASNGSGTYWVAAGASGLNAVNVNATYAWTNAHTFSNTVKITGGLTVNSSFTANGSLGTAGQVLVSAAAGNTYWATVSSLSSVVDQTATYSWTNAHTFSNTVKITGGLTVNSSFTANGSLGTAGQVLLSAGSGNVYWGSATTTVNVNATYAWTNAHTFSNTVSISGGLTVNSSFTANGSLGTAGQVLVSAGSGNVYWATAAGSALVYIGSSPPGSPTAGGLWWNSDQGTMKVYYNDGNSSQWVDATRGTPGPTGPMYGSRLIASADATSITPNANTTDVVTQLNTQAVGTLTINAATGTPTDGQKLMFRIKSTNIQTLSWNAIYVGGADLTLPSATSGSSLTDYYGFIYSSVATKWHLLSKVSGF